MSCNKLTSLGRCVPFLRWYHAPSMKSCPQYRYLKIFHRGQYPMLFHSRTCSSQTVSTHELKKQTIPRKTREVEDLKNPYIEEDISSMDPVVQRLLEGLKSGKRAALAESITLVESVHPRKKALAQVLMAHVLEFNKKKVKHSLKKTTSFRIGNHHDHGMVILVFHSCTMTTS